MTNAVAVDWTALNDELIKNTREWLANAKKQSGRKSLQNTPTETGNVFKQSIKALSPGNTSKWVVESLKSGIGYGMRDVFTPIKITATVNKTQARDRTRGMDRGSMGHLALGFHAGLEMQRFITSELINRMTALTDLELVQETRARSLLFGIGQLQTLRDDVILRLRDKSKQLYNEFSTGSRTAPNDEEQLKFARWQAEALPAFDQISNRIRDVSVVAAEGLEEESIKAIILDPKNKKKFNTYTANVKTACDISDVALGAVDLGAELSISKVPEPHVKAASLAAAVGLAFLGTVKAVFNNVAMDIALEADAGRFKDRYGVSAVYEELDKSPSAIARYLAGRRLDGLKLALKPIDVPIAAANEFVPVVKPIWRAAVVLLLAAAKGWEDKRIELAEKLLTKKPQATEGSLGTVCEALGKMIKDLGENYQDMTEEKMAKEVRAVFEKVGFNPEKLVDGATDSVKETFTNPTDLTGLILGLVSPIVGRVVQIVVKLLPADPAQIVTGDAMGEYVASITDTVGTFVTRLANVGGQIAADNTPPKRTTDDHEVLRVLSERRFDGNAYCWLAEVEDDAGKKNRGVLTQTADPAIGDFSPLSAQMPPEQRAVFAVSGLDDATVRELPTTDAKGRTIGAVVAQGGSFVQQSGIFGRRTVKVRIGDVWGRLMMPDRTFVPESLDLAATNRIDWSNYFVYSTKDRSGIRLKGTDTLIPGTWYLPLPGDTTHYLFVETSASKRRLWARAGDRVANGPDARYIIMSELKRVRPSAFEGEELNAHLFG